MYFNHRVLQESADPTVPLLERLRFLGIYSNNLDEFFRVRVAALERLKELDIPLDGSEEKPKTVLRKIVRLSSEYQQEFDHIFANIVEQLKKEQLFLLRETELNEEQVLFVNSYFSNKLIDSISPLMISHTGKFTDLSDAHIYLAIRLIRKELPLKKEFALIDIPSTDFSRFLVLPSPQGTVQIILLDDVIRLCLPAVFRSLPYEAFEAYTFKISRDAEMDSEFDISASLIEKVSKGVKKRKQGHPVRFVYDVEMPEEMLQFLLKRLNFGKDYNLAPGGRYHNFKDFMNFPTVGHEQLCYKPIVPLEISPFDQSNSIIKAIEKQDTFLHYPYFGFSQYVRILREAAIDPDVHSLKITLYRVASNSKVTRTLINAARNGKNVTAVVELMARFDEEHNIKWAKRMQEAGVHIQFGVEGLKIHSKLTLIEKKNNKGLVAVSTGNFHEGNAALYTDFTLLTANKSIVSEVKEVFNFISHPFKPNVYSQLLVSPQNMRSKLAKGKIFLSERRQPPFAPNINFTNIIKL